MCASPRGRHPLEETHAHSQKKSHPPPHWFPLILPGNHHSQSGECLTLLTHNWRDGGFGWKRAGGKMKGEVGGYTEKGTKAPSARQRAAASRRQDHFRNDCQISRISSLFKMNVAAAAEGFFRDGGRRGSFSRLSLLRCHFWWKTTRGLAGSTSEPLVYQP